MYYTFIVLQINFFFLESEKSDEWSIPYDVFFSSPFTGQLNAFSTFGWFLIKKNGI
jgi:hypothetical protein